ncbi:MAG: Na(+)/H(+) antiporter subunit B [Candidatus Cloacimonetes bacterium]|nr:Na(+)/H(+) antiporter subunit B [Candidatus Cloacimonadota bacterium]MCF7813514.1 Na(+)/H(+) antiporter subunit B [Candidatus Cloacimonadota bacterium]MCF7868702.1 Na(+)/H(+) antiporter subunit B [Candidatus Cloacimonadota bacterium]MCF7884668.1 Na(+)/H(+) antiporter subunit B [Candidatus Cloacimonadota bacterium]
MVKRFFTFLFIIFLIYILFPMFYVIFSDTELNPLAANYVSAGPDELGSQNLVTSVIVTYRGLDTLGEVTVLFIATAGVGFLLKTKEAKSKKRKASELLQTGSGFLAPIIILFGVYIFSHGHLTPGGGFQGGVIIATGILLLMLANVNWKMNKTVLHTIESLSGAFYIVIGLLGIFLAGGFLDNRILPLGEFGTLFSAGAIPIIYSLIGLKVGSELVGILDNLSGEEA